MSLLEKDQKETVVETYLVQQCTRYGALCVKNQRVVRAWPDRSVYWWQGQHDLIETKRPKGSRFEPNQERTHGKLRVRGHEVIVIYTKAQVDEYIKLRQPFWSEYRVNEYLRTRRKPAHSGRVPLR